MKGNLQIHRTPKPSYEITHLSDWLSHPYIYNPLCATEDVRQKCIFFWGHPRRICPTHAHEVTVFLLIFQDYTWWLLMELTFSHPLLASNSQQNCHHYCLWLLTRARTKGAEAQNLRMPLLSGSHKCPATNIYSKVVNTWVKDAQICVKSISCYWLNC